MDERTFSEQEMAGAREAADGFLKAVVAGDENAARDLLILVEGESLDFQSMSASVGSYDLGAPQAEGDHVLVVAAITARPGQDAPPALPLVMTSASGPWKVDMGASIQKLMGGVDLQALMEQMAKGLGDAMAQGMESMGEALSQGLGEQEGTVTLPPRRPRGRRRPWPRSRPRRGRLPRRP